MCDYEPISVLHLFFDKLNFARVIGTTLADFAIARAGGTFLSTLGANGSDEIPNTPASLIAYHSKENPAPPAAYRLFAAKEGAEKPYRQFLSLMELWGQRLGTWSYVVLNNASPWNVGKVIISDIKDINDMHSMEKRYAGAFDGPANPPGDDAWRLLNFYHVRRIFFNNYGRHVSIPSIFLIQSSRRKTKPLPLPSEHDNQGKGHRF